MTCPVTPLPGFVVIQRTDPPLSAGGLHLPFGTDDTAPKYGTVVAKGSPRVSESGTAFMIRCDVGDTVLLNGQPGTEQKLADGKSYWFIREGDIYGVVKP